MKSRLLGLMVICLALALPGGAEKEVKQKLMVQTVAYRWIPYESTTYYQTQGSAYSSCYGQGQDFGVIYQLNVNCSTVYQPPAQIPITWRKILVYNLVEDQDYQYVITCTANWRWSKCSWLNPGDGFLAERKGDKMWVTATNLKGKTMKVKYSIVQITRKR